MVADPTTVFAAVVATADSTPTWWEAVPWAALVAGAIALIVAAWNQREARRDRRRSLYSDAYRAALEWTELYYRVRRRDPANPYELVPLFHAAQESINYHEGWIRTESEVLGRAYRAFVKAVKDETRPLIQKAWAEEPCDPREGLVIPDGEHPQVEDVKRQFLADVNDHLAFDHGRRSNLSARYPPEKEI